MDPTEDEHSTSERWVGVENWKRHEISNHGRVRVKSRTIRFYSEAWDREVEKEYDQKVMSPTDNGRGYLLVQLNDADGNNKGALVHRLVMDHFGPDPPSDEHRWVNHIDGDKTNNHIRNLEWVTPAMNCLHEAIRNVAEEHDKEKVVELIRRWGFPARLET